MVRSKDVGNVVHQSGSCDANRWVTLSRQLQGLQNSVIHLCSSRNAAWVTFKQPVVILCHSYCVDFFGLLHHQSQVTREMEKSSTPISPPPADVASSGNSDQEAVKSAPTLQPPDQGIAAWTTVAGGFCLLFVSFGWISCNYDPIHVIRSMFSQNNPRHRRLPDLLPDAPA